MNKEEITEIHERIKPFIHNTPVLTSSLLNEFTGASMFFKCENFQKMGAFKMRGAMNAILQLPEERRIKGVVTHSSGNFAQALALAAQKAGVKAYIVMPKNAPEVKKNAVKKYGGKIVECKPNLKARESAAEAIIKKEGVTFIHPSNNLNVILGHATACKELLEEHPELDCIFVPVGGGGLISGTVIATSIFKNNCKVVGAEPSEANDAYRSLQSGFIESNKSVNTIADGLKTQLGDVNFPIINQYVKKIICVSEKEIISAMQLIWERLKIVCEPSSAVALAALIKEKEKYENKKIGIIISGGNIDLKNLPF